MTRATRRDLLAAAGLALFEAAPARAFFSSPGPRVVVVGAGGAGLAAAVEAARCGARVTLMEKQPAVGGDTLISGGFFAAVDPKRQRPLGIDDSIERFTADILESGGGKSDPALARILARGAAAMLERLESLGMKFQSDVIEIYGAHWPRCHKPMMPNGVGYVQALHAEALRLGVEIRTDCAVVGIETDAAGGVAGVNALHRQRRLHRSADAVVIASGGFGANARMVERWQPRLAGLTTDNTPGSTGEMLEIAERDCGAQLIDMPEIQCLPGCPANRRHRVRLHNDVSRFIFVNRSGRRFCREDERRDVLRDTVLALPGRLAYTITDAAGLRSYDILVQKEAVLGIETGDAWSSPTLEGLAEAMGLPPENVVEAVADYNAGVQLGRDRFRKSPQELRHFILEPPFWGCFAAMTIHYTMGGLRITPRAQVVDRSGRVVRGLFAAGQAAGGLHGINRMGANGINDALVFGTIAGREAALLRDSVS